MLRRILIVASLVSMIVGLVFGPASAAPPFKVDTTTPVNGAVDVPLNSDVTIVWNRSVNCGTVDTSSITISPSVGWARSSCDDIAGQAVFTPSGQASGITYTVEITTAVTDTNNDAMKNAYFLSYTTEATDTVGPAVTSTTPDNGATGVILDSNVTINWNEDIDCGTVSAASVTSNSPGWAFSSCSGSQAVFATAGQVYNTLYSVTVSTAVTDLAGNPMLADHIFSYTTEVEVLIDADTLDGFDSTDFALDGHTHSTADVNGLDAALANKADVNHNHDGVYQKKYANVLVVSKDGNGDFTNPKVAIDSITDASATNTYLVKIMPGIYEISPSICAKSYVDIEGSGRSVTKIRKPTQPLIYGCIGNITDTELRDITIEGYGWGECVSGDVVGVSVLGTNANGTRPLFTNVDIIAKNGGAGNWGVNMQAHGGQSTFRNVRIEATNESALCNPKNRGIWFTAVSGGALLDGFEIRATNSTDSAAIETQAGYASSFTLRNGFVKTDYYGVIVPSSSWAEIYNSTIEVYGGGNALQVAAGGSAKVAVSRIVGLLDNLGELKVVGCYDENFDPIPDGNY